MKVALISDIHGNLPAFQAVLADIDTQQIDQIICLGDVAEFGPQSHECLRLLASLNCSVVMGNTDYGFLHDDPPRFENEDTAKFLDIKSWCQDQVTEEDLRFIQSFSPIVRLPLGSNASLLCFHGSPNSFHDIIRAGITDDEIEQLLAGYEATVMAGGHTHTQLLRRIGKTILINPGSVGMAYERISGSDEIRNPPWAEYAILSVNAGTLATEFRRIPFDIKSFIQTIHNSGIPHADWLSADWDTNS